MKYPALESTPILAEGRLYLCSSRNKVVALDPETGREIWAHDPQIDMRGLHLLNCRGVTYFDAAQVEKGAACRGRIITGTLDGRLLELDAATGEPCAGFGENGALDLRAGLGRNRPGDYAISSPPVVVGNLIIVGGRIEDSFRTDMPAGVIRAYDVYTGALAWAWNPLPPGVTDAAAADPAEPYVRATPNAWSVFSVDAERGLVFVPTGNVQVDLYGGDRGGLENGRDYYSSSVVALEAATGRVVWHFQTVHHDIWDYDVPSQPVLFDWPTEQGTVPALVQPTKQGHLYVLNRVTGEPLVPVEERPVPQDGAVAGEYLSPTQPFPANDAFIVRKPTLTEADMWGFTPVGPRQVPRAVSRGAQRRALHAAVVAGHAHVPQQHGRHELGQRLDRRGARAAARQHQSRRDDHDHGAACRGAGTHGARRVPAAAGRYAVRVLVEAIAVTVGRAVQPAAVGNADGDRPQEPQARLGSAARDDARPRAVSDLAQARHAEHRRARHDGVGAHVHRRDDRQLPACVRELPRAKNCGKAAYPQARRRRR